MFVFRLISYLPLWCLYLISDCFYLIAQYLIGYRKNVIDQNLAHAFPDKNLKERTYIRKKFYRNFTDSLAETIKLLTISREELAKRYEIKNKEIIIERLNRGEIIVGLTSHFFNWEGHPPAFAGTVDTRLDTVYLKLNNPFFEKLMRSLRGRFGGMLVERSQFNRHYLKHRNTPRLIGLAADQRPVKEDIRYWTKFMNREAAFFEGGEKLAKRFQLTVIFSKVNKPKRGHYTFTYELLSVPPHDETPHSITERYIQRTEQNIREEPALYLWSHNRWKNIHRK